MMRKAWLRVHASSVQAGRRGLSTAPAVRTELKGDVVTIILSRPHVKNAVDRHTADELSAAFRAFEANPAAKVAVLWGEGGTFCAGADLLAISKGTMNRMEDDGDAPMGPSRMEFSKPVIAAIAGHAVAGGLELSCLCDLRVMEEDAVMGVFCRRFGVPLIDGGTVRLPRLIGQSRAMDLILTGRPVLAAEALSMGLVNRIVPSGQARAAAEQLAAEIAAHPQECMLADRRSALAQHDLPLQQALRQEFRISKPIVSQQMLGHVSRFTSKQYKQ